jgi:hypothetical protein
MSRKSYDYDWPRVTKELEDVVVEQIQHNQR